MEAFTDKTALLDDCRRIVARLQQNAVVADADVLVTIGAEEDFDALAKEVLEAIEKNKPEAGLDRLHAFVTKYVRSICAARGIDTPKEKPLHSIFGEYVKKLQTAGELEAAMTERILKSSISVLEAFNHVRNEQSMAHDNQLLNYDEALLIFSHVTNSIRFIRNLEKRAKHQNKNAAQEQLMEDEIPF